MHKKNNIERTHSEYLNLNLGDQFVIRLDLEENRTK